MENAKRSAAHAAVDEYIKDGLNVGIGSGSTVVYVVERIAELSKTKGLNVVCVPTSFQSTKLIVDSELVLSDLDRTPRLDVAIDGADEVDAKLNLIKGGGGCQTQEKIVAASAKQLVIVADHRKDASKLGQKWKKGVPIEIVPMARRHVELELQRLGAHSVTLRTGSGKAGPVVTDNGGFVLDADFGEIDNPAELDAKLHSVVGIVETGLFINASTSAGVNVVAAYFGQEDGTFKVRKG